MEKKRIRRPGGGRKPSGIPRLHKHFFVREDIWSYVIEWGNRNNFNMRYPSAILAAMVLSVKEQELKDVICKTTEQ